MIFEKNNLVMHIIIGLLFKYSDNVYRHMKIKPVVHFIIKNIFERT